MLRAIHILASFFDQSFIDSLAPRNFNFYENEIGFMIVLGFKVFYDKIVFWMHFQINMARLLGPIEENTENDDSKRHQLIDYWIDFYRFGFRFGSQLGAMLATFFGPRRPRRAPRRLQDASKTLPKTSRIAQDGPRRFQTCPRALQTSILVPPGLDFDGFWQNADPCNWGFQSFSENEISKRASSLFNQPEKKYGTTRLLFPI